MSQLLANMMEPLLFLKQLLFPLVFLILSVVHIPVTICRALINRQYSTFQSVSAFKDAWFAEFWKVIGTPLKTMFTPHILPLLESANGVVLEVGPASGDWLQHYSKSQVTRIYGVEPNRKLHPMLRENIIKAGLSDIYIIVPVGVEDLDGKGLYGGEKKAGGWVQEGELDCILTFHCLCSIPGQDGVIKGLYKYLKEGGRWLVYEHVVMKQGGLMKWYQYLADIPWPHLMAGCSLRTDPEKSLKEAGSWSKVDLKQPPEEPTYCVLPHLMGTLTK